MIPFFIFNGLTLLTKIRDIQTNGLIATVYDFFKDFFGSIFLGELPVGPTWFILSLIWMKIIMFLLLKFKEEREANGGSLFGVDYDIDSWLAAAFSTIAEKARIKYGDPVIAICEKE